MPTRTALPGGNGGPVISDEVPWELHVEQDGDGVLLRPTGDLDLCTAPLLLSEVERQLAESVAGITVDLVGIGFVDSTGIGTLVGCWRRATRAGAAFQLANPSRGVMLTLSVTGLDAVLPLRTDQRQEPAAPPLTPSGTPAFRK